LEAAEARRGRFERSPRAAPQDELEKTPLPQASGQTESRRITSAFQQLRRSPESTSQAAEAARAQAAEVEEAVQAHAAAISHGRLARQSPRSWDVHCNDMSFTGGAYPHSDTSPRTKISTASDFVPADRPGSIGTSPRKEVSHSASAHGSGHAIGIGAAGDSPLLSSQRSRPAPFSPAAMPTSPGSHTLETGCRHQLPLPNPWNSFERRTDALEHRTPSAPSSYRATGNTEPTASQALVASDTNWLDTCRWSGAAKPSSSPMNAGESPGGTAQPSSGSNMVQMSLSTPSLSPRPLIGTSGGASHVGFASRDVFANTPSAVSTSEGLPPAARRPVSKSSTLGQSGKTTSRYSLLRICENLPRNLCDRNRAPVACDSPLSVRSSEVLEIGLTPRQT